MLNEKSDDNWDLITRIAIDGPSGAGTSTVGKRVANALGVDFIDTGAFFRAVAWLFQEVIKTDQISGVDEIRLLAKLRKVKIEPVWNGEKFSIMIDEKRIPDSCLRTPKIDQLSSIVSASPLIRPEIIGLLREIAEERSVVMDGRNVGIEILPYATLKVYLTASARERALRRVRQRHADLTVDSKEFLTAVSETELAIEERDQRDQNRAHSPARISEDSLFVDTTHMSIEEVVDLLLQKIGERGKTI